MATFSATITGLAAAIGDFPRAPEAKLQLCLSLYLWMPQYIPPHLHANPVRPTFFLQEAQRFFFTFLGSFTSSGSSAAGSETAGSRTDFAAAPSTSSCSALSTTVELSAASDSSTLTFRLEREAVVAATSSVVSVELCSFFRKSL